MSNSIRQSNQPGSGSPLWILQNNGIDRVTAQIAMKLWSKGRRFLDISVNDSSTFESELSARLDEEGMDVFSRPTFFMGSVLMLNSMKASKLYSSLVVHTPENYLAAKWVHEHGPRMLNPALDVMTLGDVVKDGKRVFVRPLDEQKLFTGTVFNPANFDKWFFEAQQRNSKLSLESRVCVSEPKEIVREWRVLCFDGVPKLWSQYKECAKLQVEATIEPDALMFAQEAAAHWVPDELCTLDVAKTPEGYRIVEFNGMHCCGIYAIEPRRFIEEVEGYLAERH